MATTPTNDSAFVQLGLRADIVDDNVGAMISEYKLEKGWTNWEAFLTHAKGVLVIFGVPANLRQTAADVENAYWALVSLL